MEHHRRISSLLAIVVMAALLAACGSDASSESPDSTALNAARKQAQELPGPAIKFMAIVDATTTPGWTSALPAFEATVAAINASGGIDGHPLSMTVCDSASNPNTTANCARKAVAQKVPAVVSYTANGGSYERILAEAGIPDLGNLLFQPLQLTSPNSFALTAGGPGVTAGYVVAAKKAGCKKLSYLADVPPSYAAATQASFESFKKNAESHGLQAEDLIQATPGAPDFTPYIASAQRQGADCIVLQPLPTDVVAMVSAARKLNVSADLIMANAFLTPETVESLGSQLDGVWCVDPAWPPAAADGHPGVTQFVKDMKTYAPDRPTTTVDEVAWSGVRLFASAAEGLKKVDARSVTRALNRLHDYDPGVVPRISFDTRAPEGAIGPRMFQPNVAVAQYDGDTIEPLGYFNIATGARVPFD